MLLGLPCICLYQQHWLSSFRYLHKASPRSVSPRGSPRGSPRSASPRSASPRSASPRSPSPRNASPRISPWSTTRRNDILPCFFLAFLALVVFFVFYLISLMFFFSHDFISCFPSHVAISLRATLGSTKKVGRSRANSPVVNLAIGRSGSFTSFTVWTKIEALRGSFLYFKWTRQGSS